MPELKQIPIFDRLKCEILSLLEQRRKKGISTYGHELTTWIDKKSAILDLQEELIDALVYAKEIELEMEEILKTLQELMIEVETYEYPSRTGYLAVVRAKKILKHFTNSR